MIEKLASGVFRQAIVPVKLTRSSGVPSKSSSLVPSGSHWSPRPSRSLSACLFVPGMIGGLEIVAQISRLSSTPSASTSSSTPEQASAGPPRRTTVWQTPPAGQPVGSPGAPVQAVVGELLQTRDRLTFLQSPSQALDSPSPSLSRPLCPL